jgi:hypothetical protein
VYFAPISGSGSSAANGELTLGGTDSSKYSGSIVYTPTLTSGDASYYWGISVPAITYGSTSLGSGQAIVDTGQSLHFRSCSASTHDVFAGTTLIYIPDTAYSKFLSASGGRTDSNTGLASWTTAPTGTFSFTIASTKFTLTPSQYLFPTAQYRQVLLNSPSSRCLTARTVSGACPRASTTRTSRVAARAASTSSSARSSSRTTTLCSTRPTGAWASRRARNRARGSVDV